VLAQWFNRRAGYDPRHVSLLRRAEAKATAFSDQELVDAADALRDQSHRDREGLNVQIQFGGLIASAVNRVFGFRMHDVQLQAMLAGSYGAIVEMQTGEGKTVVTGATAALASLTSPTVHVATTNGYLAGRDLEELAPVFEKLGLSCGILPDGNDVAATQAAYKKQVTYGPGYQFGFDYLRDQVFLRENRQSQLGIQTLNAIRGTDISKTLRQLPEHHTAIIDEADSVMIDEAVTPLVISGAARVDADPLPFNLAKRIAAEMTLDEDFTIELPDHKIEVNDKANQVCHQKIDGVKNLNLERPWRIYIRNALRALHVLRREVDYVVRDGEVQIVDQNTGRIFADRTWQDGLHQAVESKEGLTIKSSPPSVAQISRQRYLLMYDQLSGLTGTSASVVDEFRNIYKMKSVTIPTNLPSKRNNLTPRFFADVESKLDALALEVQHRHQTGQPILIGTRTIAQSIQVSDKLTAIGISAVVLNGIQDGEEADIVKGAGRSGAIMIATNMAGRGTDIKPDADAIAAGGLHVIGFSPNQSARIDRQLIGRAARQGQPGSSQFFIAATDEIIEHYSPALGKRMASRCKSSGESRVNFAKEIAALQKAIESKQYASRQAMMRRDVWMDSVRESIERE
jgi:preprotein translocase subunit SecA